MANHFFWKVTVASSELGFSMLSDVYFEWSKDLDPECITFYVYTSLAPKKIRQYRFSDIDDKIIRVLNSLDHGLLTLWVRVPQSRSYVEVVKSADVRRALGGR